MSSTIKTELKRAPEAELLSGVQRFFDGLAKNSRATVLALVAITALGVLAAAVLNKREARSEAARSALFIAQKSLETELKAVAAATAPIPSKEKADPKSKAKTAPPQPAGMESVAFTKFDLETKLPDTLKKLKLVDQDFDGTRSAFEARETLGSLYYDHGDAAQAVSWYQKAVRSAPGSLEKALALSGLGYSLENSGKYQEALDAFQKAVNLGEATVKGDALMAVARCYEGLHDTAKARSTYEQIISQLPNTDYAKSAESFKAEL